MRRFLFGCVAVSLMMLATSGISQGQGMRISVRNQAEIARPQEPVVVAWSDIAHGLPGLDASSVVVMSEHDRPLMSQVDDLDADGSPDELVFVADFKAGEERVFMLRNGPPPTNIPSPPVRTDAGIWKRSPKGPVSVDDDDGPGLLRSQSAYVFDGIGWESELAGYRLYLDERNALDIQGKRIPGLYWNFIGSSGVDYQADAAWGMDVLHVGPALGSGGFAFWDGDSVVKPLNLERRRARIIARGPVRVVVRVDYRGWKVGNERLDATSLYTMYGGESFTQHQLSVAGSRTRTVAVGIVKHASGKVEWDATNGVLISSGNQSRSGEWLRMSVHVRTEDLAKVTADAWNDLLVLKSGPGREVRYVVSSRWGGKGGPASAEDRESDLRIGARLASLLVVSVR